MGLIVPPFYFANSVDNLTGTPPANTLGTNFTAGANNADGSAVSLLSALAFDCHYLILGISGIHTNNADTNALADLLVDPSGGTSWSEFIDSLTCGATPQQSAGSSSYSTFYHFPIFIKAGTSIGIRARTAHSANITTGRAVIWVRGNPNRPECWWCGQNVESLGINAASSKGTNLTPGNSGAFSAWTSIGSTTVARYGAIQFGLNGIDSSSTALGYFWQIGYGDTQLPGSPTMYSSSDINERQYRVGTDQPIFCDIAAGTQMQARATASGTAETQNCALYGVY